MPYDVIYDRRRRARVVAAGGLTYLLRDLFTTALAAGGVNGTAAEPTGQTRTVLDTNLVLSLVGGAANFATGGVGIADPGLSYPAMTTVLGMALIGTVTPANTGTSLQIGWETPPASGVARNSIRFTTVNTVQIVSGGGAALSVGAFTAGVAYKLITVQRTVGYWYLAKGGTEYSTLKLIWIGILDAPGSYVPDVTAINTTSIATADDIRVPTNTYIPPPLAYDTFTRADGALGSTETTGPDSQVLTALAWAFTVGIWTITTNRANSTPTLGTNAIVNGAFAADTDWTKGANWTIAAGVATGATASSDLTQTVAPLTVGTWYRCVFTISAYTSGTVQTVVGGLALPTHNSAATYTETGRAGTTAFLMRGAAFIGSIDNVQCFPLPLADLFASVTLATADVWVEATVTLAATLGVQAGVVLNLDSAVTPANFILCYVDGLGNCVLEECVAGVYTTKFTSAITYSGGAVLRVMRDGTSCRVFYNNLAVSTVQTMTANTNVNHGLFSTRSNNFLDAFAVWARGVGNEYATLDLY